MPRNFTHFQENWKNEFDPNGMLYKTLCKKQDYRNAWCKLPPPPIGIKINACVEMTGRYFVL